MSISLFVFCTCFVLVLAVVGTLVFTALWEDSGGRGAAQKHALQLEQLDSEEWDSTPLEECCDRLESLINLRNRIVPEWLRPGYLTLMYSLPPAEDLENVWFEFVTLCAWIIVMVTGCWLFVNAALWLGGTYTSVINL